MALVRLLAVLVVFALAAPTLADDLSPRQVIDQARAQMMDIDNALKAINLSDSDLARLRTLNDPIAARLQAVVVELTPRLAASTKRLIELTPKSKDTTTPATDTLTDELKTEQVKHDELDADLRSARALLLQSDEDASRIGAARRDLFAKQTFARSSSVLSPWLWSDLAREAPGDAEVIFAILSDWARGLSLRLTNTQLFGFLGLTAALILVIPPAIWIARRFILRNPKAQAPSRLRRAVAASWAIALLAGLPLALLGVFAYALDAFDISDPHLQGGVDALLDALRLYALAYAFGRGLLAPREPTWRLIALDDRPTRLLFRFLMITAAIWGAERVLEAAADATASLTISVASRALAATLIGLVGVGALRRIVDPNDPPPPSRDPWAPARTLAWAFLALLIGSTLAGYIAFAAFLVNQTLFVFAVGGALYLADALVQESAELILQPDAAFAKGLMTTIGLRRDTLQQIVVIVQGFARVAALLAGLIVAFSPFGLPSQDVAATLRTAYFGFTIGGVTISLSSIIGAGVVFVVAVLATRAVQAWISERYLPRTRLDPSVNHSVRALTGYVGLVIALLISGARLGLDVQQFTIVAGALSVGIGFGLQGIANNFVSGLILLWERSVRVGDWVVVGSDQGFVRAINARATEIETFDRSMLIVPNSNLVTSAVKNWMHTDRMARIVVSITVDFESDPEMVRELLIAAARAQELVLTIPAPLALFKDFGDWGLKFDLYCFVDEAMIAERVRSEIHFDVLKRLREAAIKIPRPVAGQPS